MLAKFLYFLGTAFHEYSVFVVECIFANSRHPLQLGFKVKSLYKLRLVGILF